MAYHIRDRIASIVVLILSLAAFVHILGLPKDAAVFPSLVLGLTVILSTAWLVRTFLPLGRKAGETHPFMESPRNLAIFVASIAVYIVLIDLIGYFTATVIFMVGSSLALGFRRHLFTAITVVIFVTFVYLVFVALFHRPLPVEFFQR